MDGTERRLFERYTTARAGDSEVVLEGLHAVKHCIRFEGAPTELVTDKRAELEALVASLEPWVANRILAATVTISRATFRELIPRAPASPLLAIAPRRTVAPEQVLQRGGGAVVLLENPRHGGNLGAVIRVAAAASARGVVTIGAIDPWSSAVVRGAAGLHYAIDVTRLDAVEINLPTERTVVALDPDGEALGTEALPSDVVFAFGSERRGLSRELLARADACFRIPMREGVSSLNLATAVSATLFGYGPGSARALRR